MRLTERLALCAATAAASVLAVAGVRAHAADRATQVRAEHVLHLLSYLDADYVRVGAGEKQEHVALVERAAALARGLDAPADLEARVTELQGLIRDGAPEAEMHSRLGGLRAELVSRYGIERTPHVAPDAERGRVLYEKHCATCHGTSGRADTPTAAALRPHPPSFQDAFFVGTLSPYDVTTAMRFGVDGTPMPPIDALDEGDRWDVASYVLGLPRSSRGIPASPAPAALTPGVPCSEPGFAPGPELHATDGALPFEVTHDCLFPGRTRLEVNVNVTQRERPSRAQVESLLRGLFDQVRGETAPETPELVHVCAFPDGTTDGTGRYGCLAFEGDEGPEGELSVQMDLPSDASEWLPAFAAAHPGGSARLDPTKDEVEVTTRLPDAALTTGAAAVQVFPWLFDFFPPRSTVNAITVKAVRRGKVVLSVRVPDVDAFLAMNPWPIRERMAAAHVPLDAAAARTSGEEAVLEKEYLAALAKLPPGSVVSRL